MDEKPLYGPEDCSHTGYDMFLTGYVAVMNPKVLTGEQCGVRQLLFCLGGEGGFPNAVNGTFRAISLFNGEYVIRRHSEILGLLTPELLPDRARLQLSQIRPLDSEVPKEPYFFGYCFLPNGRYASAVALSDDMEVREYIDVQRKYQHRIMVCDREDFCVLEIQEGRLLYPSQEVLDAHRKEQGGGMELKQ